MKVAFFVNNLESYSGSAYQAKTIAERFSNTDVYFFNYVKDKNIKSKTCSENIINLDSNIISNIIKITRYSKKKNIQIYHLHGFFALAIILGKILNKKIIMKTTLLGADDFYSFNNHKNIIKKIIKSNLIKFLDCNVALSDKIKQLNSKFIDSRKIVKIPNGVKIDTQSIQYKDKNYFCIVGVVCERKRTKEAIKYYIDNYSMLDESKLFIIGPHSANENLSDVDYYESCKKLCEGKLEEKIIFTGKMNSNELKEMYKKCKSIIHFSSKEGMPNVVLEAMANNVVPILSEMDGVSKEIVNENIDGFILKNFERKISIEDINMISNNLTPYQKALEKFNINTISNQYENLYLDIIKGK